MSQDTQQGQQPQAAAQQQQQGATGQQTAAVGQQQTQVAQQATTPRFTNLPQPPPYPPTVSTVWVTAGYLASKIPTASRVRVQLLPEPRHKRRRTTSFSPPKRRTKLKTACDYNLTSKYPLRLQREHQYNTRSNTPTSEQQRVQTTLNLWILFAEESKRKRKIYMAAQ